MNSAMTFVYLVLALGIVVDARHFAASELNQKEKMPRRTIAATPIPTAKITSGTLAPTAPYVVTPSSIADKGKHASLVADTGTPVSSKADTGTPASSIGNTGTHVSSKVESGTPGSSVANTGTPASSIVNTGTAVNPSVDSGTPRSSLADTGTLAHLVDHTGIAVGNPADHHEAVTKIKLQLQELEKMREQLQTEIVTGSFSKRKEQVLSHIQRQILLREKQILELTANVPDKKQANINIETNLVQYQHQKPPPPPPPLQQQQQDHYQQYQHREQQQQKFSELQNQELFSHILPNKVPADRTMLNSNSNIGEKKMLIPVNNKESTLVNDFQGQIVLSGGIQNPNPTDFQVIRNQNTNAGAMMIQGNRAVNIPFQIPTGQTFNNNLVLPSNNINPYRQSGNNNIFTGNQVAGPQHILVPINTLALDNIIQRQMFPSERYIIINKASPDTAITEQQGSKLTEIRVTSLPTAKPIQTTPLPKPTTTTQLQPTERTTQSEEEPQPPPSTVIPPTTPSGDPGSPKEVEAMKKHLLQVELKKQQLEIRKLNLEIRALQREETNMFSNMGGESEDGPQRRRHGFGARPMPFPFF